MFHVTERLLLRPAWPEDWEALHGGIADAGVVRNLARAPWPYLPAHAREFVMRSPDARLPQFLLTRPGASGSTLIGGAGLHDEAGTPAIGYWIAREHWGQGYATEAARGVLEIARTLGHRRVEGSHFLDNPASGRVLRKLGFCPTGRTARRHSCGRGGAAECALYAIDLAEAPRMRAA